MSTPGIYEWQGQHYVGMQAVADAAQVTRRTVVYHLARHGHLERLGSGRGGYPDNGASLRVLRSRPIMGFPSIAAICRHTGTPKSTMQRWLRVGEADRILAALMAADARRAAA